MLKTRIYSRCLTIAAGLAMLYPYLRAQPSGPDLIPLISLYNEAREDNFATTDRFWFPTFLSRVGQVIGAPPYRYYRQEGRVFATQQPGTVPLVLWFSDSRGDNFTTTDPEFRTTPPPGYAPGGAIQGYVFNPATPQPPGTIPLYATWSSRRADNFLTTDPAWKGTRYGEVLGGPDYIFVRVAGYVYPPSFPSQLEGFVDMHAHPMAHLGFGRKLVHGAPDIGSMLPARSRDCAHDVRATTMEEALGTDNTTHGGFGVFDNTCGDDIRKAVIRTFQSQNGAAVTPDWARGAPDFAHWPKWNDITHQKMWIDWIRRAHWGGLSVMVALAVHNRTLASAVMGPGDYYADDKATADMQIDELKGLVGRHTDFMEIAYTAADVRRIVSGGRLAVIIGVEIDGIGDFNRIASVTAAMVSEELSRLYSRGVRYIIPIHVLDNKFGGTAVYIDAFNLSNYRESGGFWDLVCSAPGDRINYRYNPGGFDFGFALVKATKLGIDVFRNPPTPPACGPGTGHVNRKGLTPLGIEAIKTMMRMGMLIDVDHMSQKSVEETLPLAEAVPGGYPLNSGHNGFRGDANNENSRTGRQIQRIAALGGVFGVGMSDADPASFIQSFSAVANLMGNRSVGIGTDLNGLVKGPRPAPVRYDAHQFPNLRTGNKVWDYGTDGGAHYGMIADFVKAIRDDPRGESPSRILNLSAEHFASMWEKAETQKGRVR